MMDKYARIIDLPHHVSKVRPQMSMYQRAAQFAPFAALTGDGAGSSETARLTDKKIALSESESEILNMKTALLVAHVHEHPDVCITHFVPDKLKEGGCYVTYSGTVNGWDEYERCIVFDDGTRILTSEILDMEGELFDSVAR